MNKDIGTVTRKIRKLESRRFDLANELNELKSAEVEVTSKLGAAILEGGNTSKIEGDLTLMTARRSGLSAAVSKADADLTVMRSNLVNLREKAARVEIEGVISDVKAEMGAAGDVIQQLLDDGQRWIDEIRGAADRADALHLVEEKGRCDHLLLVWPFDSIQGVWDMLNTRKPFVSVRPIEELRDPTIKAEFRK